MENKNANNINVTLNLIQSLFKFNKLDNDKTCQGLRHWRLLSHLKNNFSKPVRNDMGRHTEDGSPKYLHTLGSRFFAHARIKRIRLRLNA